MLKNWNEIKDEYQSCPILIGNGFTMNFSQRFAYKSLHNSFANSCTRQAWGVFDFYDTQNFEIVLKNLEIAAKVNEQLGLQYGPIEELRNEIRSGLVHAISELHPKADKIDFDQTKYVSGQLKFFSDIFTTNYDLYLYYLVLDAGKHFGDYFYQFHNDYFTEFVPSDEMNDNHIYYLHGALFLFGDDFGYDGYKIKGRGEYLLDSIARQIQFNNYPMFVSEGSSQSKLNQIHSERYLTFCYEHLQNHTSSNIAVYGHSLSEQDHHIVQAIEGHYKKVAIGIRSEAFASPGAVKSEIHKISQHFVKTEPIFYDSNTLFSFHEIVDGRFTKAYRKAD